MFFFLHDKVDVMKNDDIRSIASSFYSEDEIKSVKQTLYRFKICEAEFVDHRGDDATKNSNTDVLHKLITVPHLQVKFCVTNSWRLPLVSIAICKWQLC